MKQLIGLLTVLIITLSCAQNSHRAPIADIQILPQKKMDYHIVAPGETLYSIALTYDLDYKILSKVNNLGRDYAIVPGQRLSLKIDEIPQENASENKPKSELKNVADTFVKVASEVVESIKSQAISSVKKPSKSEYSAKIKWVWPAKGKVLVSFAGNNGLNKGIDIQGKLGESIHAAADGEVIYAGSGLRDYGNLVILKHGENFLSAYAHNRVLNVKEGDSVKAGSKIAEIGVSGPTNLAKLHFEIRVSGKPVDPLKYLPSR